MSATVDRPAATPALARVEGLELLGPVSGSGSMAGAGPGRPAATPALARVEGLELLGPVSGSGYKAGAALVRRADGQMVQLGPLTYGLLEEIDGERDNEALAEALSERLGRRLEAEQVAALA